MTTMHGGKSGKKDLAPTPGGRSPTRSTNNPDSPLSRSTPLTPGMGEEDTVTSYAVSADWLRMRV